MNWTSKHVFTAEERAELQQELNIHPVFIQLLLQRGIRTFDEARTYFRPAYSQLHSPYRMKDMQKAVQRIQKAMMRREQILVYGDYDVDGTTAVSMVVSFIRDQLRYENVGYYIPDRYTEGYGVSYAGISYAADNGFGLLITLDCGIKSLDKILHAQTLGIDTIVCDHHLPDETLPPAVAILNPKQKDCAYPFKELSGCGVAFKLLQALADENGLSEEAVYEYVDFAAISTCADIVPLTGENRVLVHFGMERINRAPRPGFLQLLKKAGAEGRELNVEDAVFILGPRINAAGRIAHGSRVVELLTGGEGPELSKMAAQINENNLERQDLDREMTREALEMIAADNEWSGRSSTVVYRPHWHKGVVGIVASRIIEKHYRPTIVLTESNGKITGSARSIKGFDLYDALSECDDLLLNWGGHTHAAGLTMEPENLPEFIRRFDMAAVRRVKPGMLEPVLEYDAEIPLSFIGPSFFRILKQFAPFGPGNMSPVFCIRNLKIYNGHLRLLKEEHLQMQLYSPEQNFNVYNAIGFKLGEKYEAIRNAPSFSVLCSLKENHFNGQTTLQLDIKDLAADL
ncbi:MAG: single-stranded-DNA-specific exonuclease RecJ [Bacteroidia bacterium]|nr:single-stranded-DNA-specific exonuclease RecJ [Bacteroidia bacterium]